MFKTWQELRILSSGRERPLLFLLPSPLSSSSLLSIPPSLVIKRTTFLPRETQFTASVANAKESSHTHREESSLNIHTIIQIIVVIIITLMTVFSLKDNNLSLASAQCTDRVVDQAQCNAASEL